MDSLDRTVFRSSAAETGAGKVQSARSAKKVNKSQQVQMSDDTKNAESLKIAALALAGLALIAVAGVRAYRKHQRTKPLTRLQHLKAQLGLSDADFRDLKANLEKSEPDQLKEMKKAAW